MYNSNTREFSFYIRRLLICSKLKFDMSKYIEQINISYKYYVISIM